jgi:hypothetical protein
MHRVLTTVAITFALGAMMVGAYAIYPPSTMGLKEFIPQPAALAAHDSWGCGSSSHNGASVTKFYKGLEATSELRQKLNREMLSRGFTKTVEPWGTVNRKERGGFPPIRSSLTVSKNGSVSCAASTRKW